MLELELAVALNRVKLRPEALSAASVKMMRATTTLLSLLSLLVAIDGFRPVFKPAGPRALTRSVPRMAPTADGMPTEEGK